MTRNVSTARDGSVLAGILFSVFRIFTVIGRLITGVHWFTDIASSENII